MTVAEQIAVPRTPYVDPVASAPTVTSTPTLVIPTGSALEVSTLLGLHYNLPDWTLGVLGEIRNRDPHGKIRITTLQRLLGAISTLPAGSPVPEVGVGDDGSVGLEWDLDGVHLEIQVDNDQAYDAALIELNDDPVELPLASGAAKIARVIQVMTSST